MKKNIIIISIFFMLLNFNIVLGVEDTNIDIVSSNKATAIEPGIYEIYTLVDDTKVINIDKSSKSSGANANIYERLNQNNQKFKIAVDEDGYYTFTCINSNKVLDVQGAGKINGTNVWQYENNNTDAQKWKIVSSGNGTYSIVSKLNGLYLDVSGGINANGRNIQVYQGNNSKAQKFKFSKVLEKTGTRTISDGTYWIYSNVASDRLLEVPNVATNNEAVLKTAKNNGKASQKFKISYNGDGTYSIKLLHTGKAVDVKGASGKNLTPVQQYSYNNTDAQKWIILENADNTYSIISKCNGLALDIQGASTSIGASVQTYHFNGSNAQKFQFQMCTPEQGKQDIEDGLYRILTLQNQKFEVKYIGDGYYKIIAKHSNKVLTVESQNPRIGSEITQQEDRGVDTQKWILKKQSEGVYSLISKCGNLYIDVVNSNVQNGQKLVLKEQTDLSTQQFIFVNETPKDKITIIQDGIYQITSSSGKVLDIAYGSYGNTANVQLWNNDKVQQQKFHITRVQNTNYYKIVAVHSAKALDVQSGDANLGANVNQYSVNGTDNQYWLFKDLGNGYYNIISKANGLCLDVLSGAINKNGSNVQLYYGNGTNAQKFKLVPINIINNNTYEIETKLNSNMIIDVSGGSKQNKANVQIWTADNVEQQKFTLSALTTDTYKITAKHSNKALTIDTQTNNVYQSDYVGSNNQQWQIKEAGEGYYTLTCKANGKNLDVYNGSAVNGQNVWGFSPNGSNAQKFRFVTGSRNFFEEGTYGRSGLAVKGDSRGTNLKYYKFGKGSKKLFATFSIHGFEDSYNRDGAELTFIAEQFKNYLQNNLDFSIINNWTIYIFPDLNPDGQNYGWTNNGPGRNTLYSMAPGNKGIDMNRNWSVSYKMERSDRNYNGTAAFQAYEARDLRDFILNHQGSKNIVVDIHGWLNETIGDNGLGSYYRSQFNLPKHISSYGSGYLVNWARTVNNTRSVLVELPQVWGHDQTVNWNYPQKFINATMQMLREN